ncbi:MAG TPA: malonic semialdehyde reductase [Streptosporangiaceae bacterium]|nr:malonic semialdehyde reductase [Streptosporangiaceae bacterium]
MATTLEQAADLVLDPAAQDLLFRQARSATEFTDDPVSEAQLRAVYGLVKFGPTALNQQPLRVIAVRSREARDRLLRHLNERNRRKTAGAPLTLILAADIDFHERLPQVFSHAPGLRDVLAADREGRVTQARFNATLQIGYFIIGVRAAGLAAGPMIGFDAAALDRDFFPGGSLESLLVMNVGHPLAKRYARLPRLRYEDVVDAV